MKGKAEELSLKIQDIFLIRGDDTDYSLQEINEQLTRTVTNAAIEVEGKASMNRSKKAIPLNNIP